MITFTPLTPSAGTTINSPSSTASSSTSPLAVSPVSYLLEVDDVKILMDLGGFDPRVVEQESYDTAYEDKIRELAPKVDLLLLSHSSMPYLSFYPYARTHLNLKCPVYATQPTVEMGRLGCIEEVLGWRNEREIVDEQAVGKGKGKEKEKIGEEADVMDVDAVEGGEGDKQKKLKGPFVCTVEEVNEAFDHIKAIRYNQPIHLSGLLSHLLLTPYPSGQTLGGSIFKLRSPTSGTLLYALGMNHTTERHLAGTVLLPTSGNPAGGGELGLGRPDLLIVEGGRSLRRGAKMKDRAGALLQLVTNTLASNNSLLFPVDHSPRLLEMLILLEQHWTYQMSQAAQAPAGARQPPWNYPLCLVSRTGEEGIRLARSLMEWMGGSIAAEGEGGGIMGGSGAGRKRKRFGNAGDAGDNDAELRLRHVRFFPTVQAYEEACYDMRGPKCVLAVPMTMSYGPSRRLFTKVAEDRGMVVVLTGRTESGTLGQELFDKWEVNQGEGEKYGMGSVGKIIKMEGEMDVRLDNKEALRGEELEEYERKEREEKEKEAAELAQKERSRRLLEADDLESDSDSDGESADEADEAAGGRVMNQIELGISGLNGTRTNGNRFMEDEDARTTSFDIYVKGQQVRTTGFFKSGFGGGAAGGQARFRMFPFVEWRARKMDAYGEAIDLGAWMRKGREIEEDQEGEEVKEAKRRQKEEEERAKEPPEPPSKYTSENIHLHLQCQLFYVDMEGQHDGRAIKTIIPQLNPRKIILIKSYEEATDDLLVNLHAINNLTKDIYAPKEGEIVTIGEQTQSYSISLSEGLMGDVQGRWAKFEDYEVANVAGKIITGANMAIPILEMPEDVASGSDAVKQEAKDGDEDMDVKPQLKALTTRKVKAAAQLPQTLFIGDLRLTALKATLSALSIPAEFAGEGVLICGPGVPTLVAGEKLAKGMARSVVAVRKTTEGKIEMEGSMGDVYYKVREALYGNFAQVMI